MLSDKDIIRRKVADKARLEEGGTQAALQVGYAIRRAAVAAYREGYGGKYALSTISKEVERSLIDAMIAGHVMGIYRVRQDVRQQTGLKLGKTDDTLKWLRARLAMTPKDWEELEKIYGREARKLLDPFFDMQAEAIEDAVNKAVAQGASAKDGIKIVQEAMTTSSGTPVATHTAEAVYRTQANFAYTAGQQAQLSDPAIDEILWGFKYVTVGDNRVRDDHEAWDGVTLPKNDPFWLTHMPPNGWNCRCDVIELYEPRDIVQAPAMFTPSIGPNKDTPIVPRVAPGFEINAGKVINASVPGAA